jgi:hypothetical protein
MKLITEVIPQIQTLTEDVGGKKRLHIQGLFAQAGRVNRNNRIYPLKILEQEMNRYRVEKIDTSRALGELGHSASPNGNLDRSAILIRSLEQHGNDFVGKALVLDTPCGQVLERLIQSGVSLGISTRALGSTVKLRNGTDEVQDDLRLMGADIVQEPSVPDAYVSSLMEETEVEWVLNESNGMWVSRPSGPVLPPSSMTVEEALNTRVLRENLKFIKSHSKAKIYAAKLGRIL